MTEQVTRIVPAGWYQDPAVTEHVRWWNGLSWTEHVREKPTASPVVSREAASDGEARGSGIETETVVDRIKAARELEREFGVGTSENEIITDATALGFGAGASDSSHPDGESDAARNNKASGTRQTSMGGGASSTVRTETGASWLIALTPVLTFLVGLAATYCYYSLSTPALIFAVAVAAPYLLAVLWAFADGRALRARGLTPPSPAWALLSALVYLVVRRTQLKGSGPLIMFVVLGALIVLLPLAAAASGQLNSLTSALTIHNSTSNY